jgi:hypothetical protein
MQPGWNVWEDGFPSFWVANGTMKKKSKIKYIVALDGCQQINHTQQSTENSWAQRRRDRRGGSTGMEHGRGRDLIVLGMIELGWGGKKLK